MRRLILAVVLACALSGIARGGEIPTTGVTPPPPPPPASSELIPGEIHPAGATAPIAGEIHSTGATTTPEPDSTLLTIILMMISIVS